jgi:RNA-directed DNA polymerase
VQVNFIRLKPKYVLDTDIEKCFDRISHDALLAKLSAIPIVANCIRGWLKAGIFEDDELFPSEAGVPQGGVLSPLLANIALHGLETALTTSLPTKCKPGVIRYADDLVVLHADLDALHSLRKQAEAWLAPMGLNLKASKTRITHTLHEHEGALGFDFLGFSVRQFPTGKYRSRQGFPGPSARTGKTIIKPSKKAQKRHLQKMAELIRTHRGSNQTALLTALNPRVRGWANYYRSCSAKKVYDRMDSQLYWKLRKWAKWRHPRKTARWRHQRYWQRKRERLDFCDGHITLVKYADTKIQRHTKVQGDKSPLDGDWTYWVPRLGRDPSKPTRVVLLLKRQHGRCNGCGLRFMPDDLMEVHHLDGDRRNQALTNLALLHGHCHDEAHRRQCS